jgi:hypothetical protein
MQDAPRQNRGKRTKRWEIVFWVVGAAAWLAVYIWRMPFYTFIDYEQLRNGLLASGLLDGLAASPARYLYGASRGPLVLGLLLTPFFLMGGSKFLWIKVVGGLFVAGALVFWTAALRRAWGFSAAALFFLLHLFPPPLFEWNSHMFWGNHMESTFFVGLLFYLFVRQGTKAPKLGAVAVFGLLAGFATFFCLQSAPAALALAALAVWQWRGAGVRLLAPAAAFFAVSFALFFLLPSPQVWLTAEKVGQPHVLAKLFRLYTFHFPRMAGYNHASTLLLTSAVDGVAYLQWMPVALERLLPALSAAFCNVAALGLILSAADVARSERRRDATAKKDWFARLLLVFFLLWSLTYGFSDKVLWEPPHFLSNRYLMPIYLVLAAFLCRLLSRIPGVWKWLAIAPFLIGGFCHLTAERPGGKGFFERQMTILVEHRGEDYEEFVFSQLPPTDANHLAKTWKTIAKVPRRWRDYGYMAAGRSLYLDKSFPLLVTNFAGPPEGRAPFSAGVGFSFGLHLIQLDQVNNSGRPGLEEKTAAWLAMLGNVQPDVARAFAEGLGYAMFFNVVFLGDKLVMRGPAEAAAADQSGTTGEAEAIRATTLVRDHMPQLSADEFCRAFVRGAARYIGGRHIYFAHEQRQHFVEFWTATLGGGAPAENLEAFQEGYAAGQAQYLVNNYNAFTYRDSPADLRRIEAALAQRGVSLRRIASDPDKFALEFAH